MQGGFVQEQPRARLNQMGAMGDYAKRGALQLILTGGMWPRVRRSRAGLAPLATCSRCGMEDED
eukprot:10701879-Heterocapsa_arctica.AAC.1